MHSSAFQRISIVAVSLRISCTWPRRKRQASEIIGRSGEIQTHDPCLSKDFPIPGYQIVSMQIQVEFVEFVGTWAVTNLSN